MHQVYPSRTSLRPITAEHVQVVLHNGCKCLHDITALSRSPFALVNLLLQLIALPHHRPTEELEVVRSNEPASSLQQV